MRETHRFLEIIQNYRDQIMPSWQIASGTIGEVISVTPLTIQVGSGLCLTEPFLVILATCSGQKEKMEFWMKRLPDGSYIEADEGDPDAIYGRGLFRNINGGLLVGDRVCMIRLEGGKTFAVIGKIQKKGDED